MARIDPHSKRPRGPTGPKEVVAGKAKPDEKPPESEDSGPRLGIAGWDKFHRLSRGTESRTWGDREGQPSSRSLDDRPAGPPEPVRPGKKGDHGGIRIPPDPRPIDAGESMAEKVEKKDEE